jgi:hypothetical protein
MHRESVFLCTYSAGPQRVVGRVRAWDEREAAQLFAAELEDEHGGPVESAQVCATKAARSRRLVRRVRAAGSSR